MFIRQWDTLFSIPQINSLRQMDGEEMKMKQEIILAFKELAPRWNRELKQLYKSSKANIVIKDTHII